ncbi:MAG: hypothetical protein AAGH99_05170 [Planctomycetota bacterium]
MSERKNSSDPFDDVPNWVHRLFGFLGGLMFGTALAFFSFILLLFLGVSIKILLGVPVGSFVLFCALGLFFPRSITSLADNTSVGNQSLFDWFCDLLD